MSPDTRRIILAQAVRAFAYGAGSVLLGASLSAGGLSPFRVGLVLTALLSGTALASVAVALRGDRIGRRRSYAYLFALMGVAGAVFALTGSFPLLLLAALTGAVSADVVESGPFTSLEVAMFAQTTRSPAERNRVLGLYNAVATVAGSVGALAAGGPELLRRVLPAVPPDRRWLLLYPAAALAGLLVVRRLSPGVESAGPVPRRRQPLGPSRRIVMRLSGLFALDSFAGGFVVQSFLVYWFAERHGASTGTLGLIFFAVGILQSLSFLAAVGLAARIGLLRTMVFTHLPSNLLLAAIPLAPSFGAAILLLLGRFALSQMDVPARQAYVVAAVTPEERTAAAGFTGGVRTLVRPAGPALAGALFGAAAAAPFLVAGGLKGLYDVLIFLAFRNLRLAEDAPGRGDGASEGRLDAG